MLIMIAVTLSLLALTVGGIAWATAKALARLELDPMDVLLFLGLAERPIAAPPPRQGRRETPRVERPSKRRRSPHRRSRSRKMRDRGQPAY